MHFVLEQYSEKKLVGVSGVPLSICGCGNVQVLLKGSPFMVTCIVTDDITVDAILGLDFLEANNYVIDRCLQLLTFPSQKLLIPIFSKPSKEQGVATIGLILNESTVVPSRKRDGTDGKNCWSDHQWHMGCTTTHQGVMVANAVVSPNSNEVPVRTLNPCDEKVVLKKGTQIELLEQDPVMSISTVMEFLWNARTSYAWEMVSKVGAVTLASVKESN